MWSGLKKKRKKEKQKKEKERKKDRKYVRQCFCRFRPLSDHSRSFAVLLGEKTLGSSTGRCGKVLDLDSCKNTRVGIQGNTGLHYAAGYGRKELVEYLLKVHRDRARCW